MHKCLPAWQMQRSSDEWRKAIKRMWLTKYRSTFNAMQTIKGRMLPFDRSSNRKTEHTLLSLVKRIAVGALERRGELLCWRLCNQNMCALFSFHVAFVRSRLLLLFPFGFLESKEASTARIELSAQATRKLVWGPQSTSKVVTASKMANVSSTHQDRTNVEDIHVSMVGRW